MSRSPLHRHNANHIISVPVNGASIIWAQSSIPINYNGNDNNYANSIPPRSHTIEKIMQLCRGREAKFYSRAWFRSTDLWVMGPARFHCATLLQLMGVEFFHKFFWPQVTSACLYSYEGSKSSKISMEPGGAMRYK